MYIEASLKFKIHLIANKAICKTGVFCNIIHYYLKY